MLVATPLLAKAALSQTNLELLISWQAKNYVPSAYVGKVLPIANTPVIMALELIDNKKIADISKKEVRWFANNQLIQSGIGLKNITFIIPTTRSGDENIKAVVINYRGTNLEKSIIIPVVNPEVVINAPYPDKKITSGINTFIALPYFFNVNSLANLAFTWLANNQQVTDTNGNPDILTLDTTGGLSGNQIIVSVTAANINNDLELAKQISILEIK